MVYERTLHDYFEGDFGHLRTGAKVGCRFEGEADGPVYSVERSVSYVRDAHSLVLALYLGHEITRAGLILALAKQREAIVRETMSAIEIRMQAPQEPLIHLSTAGVSPMLYVYFDHVVPEHDRLQWEELARANGTVLVVRDAEYARRRNEETRKKPPIAFISHDSRDKPAVATPLHVALLQGMPRERFWFDESELHVGARVRETIETGLKECENCVLVLSPSYLSNQGWARGEFDAVFTRELIEKTDRVLPVWVDVKASDVFDYSPSLANRMAAIWNGDANATASQLIRAMQRRRNPAAADGPWSCVPACILLVRCRCPSGVPGCVNARERPEVS